MSKSLFKYFLFLLLGPTCFQFANGQSSFLQTQKSSFRVSNAFSNKEAILQKQFEEKKLEWPARYVYIRSFKFDSQLEVWVKNNPKDKYQLFKTYRVCMQSGTMGPKRLQGDFQIPEGFYYINEFNPRSAYHLSLGLNYPNSSDRILSDSLRPGNGIYIHGSCVSIGCVSVNDSDVEEIYILTAYAKAAGQEFIPVHIFPVRYNSKRSAEYLDGIIKINPSLAGFFVQLKTAFDFFDKNKELPLIMVDQKGNYLFD
ncbi:MAG: L,D-transpeptidase family protein [Ginsengibacter sp.]|jgi:murein L,D-transpeptidase YafK